MNTLDPHDGQSPHFSEAEIEKLAAKLYGISVSGVRELDSYSDRNFYLKDSADREYVFKISNSAEQKDVLDMQIKAIEHLNEKLQDIRFPAVCATLTGEQITAVKSAAGTDHFVRLLTFLPGAFLGDVQPHTPELLHDFGFLLGTIDNVFSGFSHRAANRHIKWDVKNFREVLPIIEHITDLRKRAIVEFFLLQFDTFAVPVLPDLRSGIIHNDGNDYNVLVETNAAGKAKIKGMIDFGDMLYGYIVCEPAIAAAYAALSAKENIIETAAHVIAGYHRAFPLMDRELDVVWHLICARLCLTVAMSAFRRTLEPENEYLQISEKPAWDILDRMMHIDPCSAQRAFRRACGFEPVPGTTGRSSEEIMAFRRNYLGPSLSVSYKKPLKIVRGVRQYLYDESGRAYLDCVNNVCHVGHCHPRVVRAAQRQMAILNTNTRYLHENIVEYARRLCANLPEPLRVCFFVNSGSEANDLALRLARTHTASPDTIVVDHAYHGNLSSLIEISPYKFDGPGGRGAAPYVYKVAMPDVYRGIYKTNANNAGKKYAALVGDVIDKLKRTGKKPGVFICESLPGVGGQIVLPENYLNESYRYVRAAGGVCIADEVQVGFGRVGTHFWGFSTQDALPDIVTLGKPIGNGFPLAAVVTTAEIAASFHTGMEYFNTFGGNPVACAVGLTVLDVIKDEGLQGNALTVGSYMLRELKTLAEKYPLIGDVRGLGLFIGIELVKNRETLAPAVEAAAEIIERMKDAGILLSADGPLHNVIKIKPPIVFTRENAGRLVSSLDRVLKELQ